MKKFRSNIWDKVFKSEPIKICVRQSLKNLKGYGLPKAELYCRKRPKSHDQVKGNKNDRNDKYLVVIVT